MAWIKQSPGFPNVPGASHVPTLNPGELFEKRKTRDASRLKAYNQILEQIHSRILSASRNSSDPFIMYTVPPFILGLPRLDLEDCIIYVVYQLRQQSYIVRYTYPNLLFISWAHHEKEYLQKQSPITQAMTPLHVEKKTQQSRVRFSETVLSNRDTIKQQPSIQEQQKNAISIINSRNPISNKAPPRNVNEYKPPTSFLDALERPMKDPASKNDILGDLWNF